MRAVLHRLAATLALASVAAPALAQAPGAVKLVGRASEPAGPSRLPLGVSAALDGGDGTLLLVADHAAGQDPTLQPLEVHRVRPRFEPGGPGSLEPIASFTLRDPDRRLDFAITHQFTPERALTAADLTLRSLQRAPDGTLWFGDATGPFLVHTDAAGKVLEPPVRVPDAAHPGREVRSPDNPYCEESASVRVMNALRAHARAHGATRMPIFAPYSMVLDDGDPATVSPLRILPGSPSSEVFNVARLQGAGHAVIPWTVNDLPSMKALMALGVRGLISDRPDLLRQAVESFDADGDGRPGDYLDADGLIDHSKFDAQGHRGARNLRPESTLPAFEAALDQLMTTLETDCAITADGVPVLHHDPIVSRLLVRRLDNGPVDGPVYHHRLRALQTEYDLGRLVPLTPTQRKDPALSPVAVAYARDHGWHGPYFWPTLKDAYRFVRYYERYYHDGPGRSHPEAAKRWRNAARVHFDIETKLAPILETTGITPKASAFVTAMAEVVRAEGMEARTMIQSFDLRTLLDVQARYPSIQTMWLVGEVPPFSTRPIGWPAPAETGPATLWAGDVVWPFRQTYREHPPLSPREGGLGGLALAPDGQTLYPVLQRPLTDAARPEVPIYAFDLARRRFETPRGSYRLAPGSASVPDFVLTAGNEGLMTERADGSAFKKVFRVRWGAPGEELRKAELANLAELSDPQGLWLTRAAGAAGLTRPAPVEAGVGLIPLGGRRYGLMTRPGAGRPDGPSLIVIELDANAQRLD